MSAPADPTRSAVVDAVASRHVTGRLRWVVAALLVTGPALQLVEFLLETAEDDSAARVAWWTDHLTRTGVSLAAGLLAVPFLIAMFALLVWLTLPTSRRLGWAAAALLTCAMVGLAAIHGAEIGAYGLARGGREAAAVAALEGEDVGLPGVVLLLLFLVGAALGVLALVVVTWRSPLLPRAVPVLILAFAVMDFVAGWGVLGHAAGLAAQLVAAWAVVTGYTRRPRAGGGAVPGPRSPVAGTRRRARQ